MKKTLIAISFWALLAGAVCATFTHGHDAQAGIRYSGKSGGSAASVSAINTKRVQRAWRLQGSTAVTYDDAPAGAGSVASYGAGVRSAAPLSTRPGLACSMPAGAGATCGFQTGPVVRPGWLPKLYTEIRPGSVANITHTFLFNGSAGGTCNIGAGSTQFTPAASYACTTTHMGIVQDTRSGSPTQWWCCSGDGVNASCISTGVNASAGTDYELLVDASTAGTLSCSVNGTTVSKSTNLPASGLDTAINFVMMNNQAGANTGPTLGPVIWELQIL
jgi:hypothetical protein